MTSYYQRRVEEFERRMIRRALRKTVGNVTEAAQILGLSFRQLRYRIKVLGMKDKAGRLKPFW